MIDSRRSLHFLPYRPFLICLTCQRRGSLRFLTKSALFELTMTRAASPIRSSCRIFMTGKKNMQWTEEERLRANNAKTLPSLEELEYEVASLLSSENSITHLQVIASAIAPEWHKIRTGAVCQDSNEFG